MKTLSQLNVDKSSLNQGGVATSSREHIVTSVTSTNAYTKGVVPFRLWKSSNFAFAASERAMTLILGHKLVQ